MTASVLIHMNAAFFFATFLFALLRHHLKLHFNSHSLYDLLPSLVFIVLFSAGLKMTPFTLFKHLLVFWLAIRLLPIKNSSIKLTATFCAAFVLTIAMFLGLHLGRTLVSTLLIVLGLLTFQVDKDASKDQKVLLMIALISFSVGFGYVGYFFAASTLLIYQVSVQASGFKEMKTHYEKLAQRNALLESKFDRAVLFEAKKRTSDLSEHIGAIREKSIKDALTGALNRSGMDNAVEALIASPNTKIFSLVLFDIDDFKQINDASGHIVGDQALKDLASILNAHMQKNNILGRFGGDEFVLLMPSVNAPKAFELCEKLKSQIKKETQGKLSVSMGISTYPYDGRTFNDLVLVADKGLYASKEKGKDTVTYLGNVPMVHRPKR